MPLFREPGITFIHIPKTAGTSIELALGLDLNPAIENPGVCFGRLASPDLMKLELSSQFLQHLRLAEVEKLHPDFVRDSWVFTVVRDPWTRLVSSFRRKDRPWLILRSGTTALTCMPSISSSMWSSLPLMSCCISGPSQAFWKVLRR
ncbi:MAG: sulfotransferase family 2 domain-containing protein [Deltaproteobacteria bacterium]|nr:sulfotransferase family 2 domain-containing protein [Deltaproteobacteria bacterium]